MAGFRKRPAYVFEMVDAAITFRSTCPTNQSILFTNFRRIKLNAITCHLSRSVSRHGSERSGRLTETRPGSRDVFSASHGILARAGPRAAAKGKDTRIGEAAANWRFRSCPGRDRSGLGHESVLQAPAGRL